MSSEHCLQNGGGSPRFCSRSFFWPQLSHWYSYSGMLAPNIDWLAWPFAFGAVEFTKPDVAALDAASPVELYDLSHVYP